MVRAVRGAAADAGSEALLAQIESISVPQGMWEYRNPGRLIADALGCPSARSILSDLGRAAAPARSATSAAPSSPASSTSASSPAARRSSATCARRSRGQPVTDTEQPEDTPPPDVHHTSSDPWATDLGVARGLASPVELFAIIESALRHADGLDVERHRDRIAQLYSRFSAVAAANPHAWRRETLPRRGDPRRLAAATPCWRSRTPSGTAASGTSTRRSPSSSARRRARQQLGLAPRRLDLPAGGGAVEARRAPGAAASAAHPSGDRPVRRAGARAGGRLRSRTSTPPSSTAAFPRRSNPSPGICGCRRRARWTVTGAMPFAGGPYNSFSLEGVARMVEVLREGGAGSARRIGLVSNLSGIFGKQACALLLEPARAARDTGYEDVTAAVAERDVPLPLDGDYVGPGHDRRLHGRASSGRDPSHAIAICDTPGGRAHRRPQRRRGAGCGDDPGGVLRPRDPGAGRGRIPAPHRIIVRTLVLSGARGDFPCSVGDQRASRGTRKTPWSPGTTRTPPTCSGAPASAATRRTSPST